MKIGSKADGRLHAARHRIPVALGVLSRGYSRLPRDTVGAGDSLLDLNISINNRLYGAR